jgi:hypothetical protein
MDFRFLRCVADHALGQVILSSTETLIYLEWYTDVSKSDMSLNNQSLSVSGLHGVDGLLLESIDQVLVQLLGERVRGTIYTCLERQGLHKHQIPEYLPRFDAFLERNLGISGRVIERHIARRLYELLGLEFVEVPHYALTDYVDMATRL